jgi:hypothetical protein
VRPLSKPERETIVTMSDDDKTACVWTAQRPVIRKLMRTHGARLINQGSYGATPWAEFEIPAGQVVFRSASAPLAPVERIERHLRVVTPADAA